MGVPQDTVEIVFDLIESMVPVNKCDVNIRQMQRFINIKEFFASIFIVGNNLLDGKLPEMFSHFIRFIPLAISPDSFKRPVFEQ